MFWDVNWFENVVEKLEEARVEAEKSRREADRMKKELKEKLEKEGLFDRKKPLPAYRENAADRKLTGSFESNKGKLPWPVSGTVVAAETGIAK